MKVALFGAKSYDREYFSQANKKFNLELVFLEPHLNTMTASLAKGFDAVCAFVNDVLDEACLRQLAALGIQAVALRCAGFNNVDLNAAAKFDINVVRVPKYSPYSVAEHAVGLILALNRKLYKSYNRVRESNFLLDGLLGFDLHQKTVGVIGVGNIGAVFCDIMQGFGCRLLAYDPMPNDACINKGVEYGQLEALFKESDIISLHCPLSPETHHLIDGKAIACMKDGVMLINTSRGALIDTGAVIKHLKAGKIGYLGLDVYEEEADIFFEDISNKILEDDTFARLLTFPNVLITGHQGFFTRNALEKIANTTLRNLSDLVAGAACPNQVLANQQKK